MKETSSAIEHGRSMADQLGQIKDRIAANQKSNEVIEIAKTNTKEESSMGPIGHKKDVSHYKKQNTERRFGKDVGEFMYENMSKIQTGGSPLDAADIKSVVTEARKLETHTAHDLVKMRNDKEGLLFTLADLRIKADQAKNGGLSKGSVTLLNKEITRIQKMVDTINGANPEVTSSDDHAKISKIIEEWNAGKREWRKDIANIARAEKKLETHPNDGRVLGDAIRAENELHATEESLAELARQAELIEEKRRPNPVRDESIANYSNKEALEAKEKFKQTRLRTAPGVFGHVQAIENMQREMNVVAPQEKELHPEVSLEITPPMELIPTLSTQPPKTIANTETPPPKHSAQKTETRTIKEAGNEQRPVLSDGALAVLKNADEHGIPKYADRHLIQTAIANGVRAKKGDRAEYLINKLRAKIDPGLITSNPTEQKHHTGGHKTHENKQRTNQHHMNPERIQQTASTNENNQPSEHVESRRINKIALEALQTQAYENFGRKEEVTLGTDIKQAEHFARVEARTKEVTERQAVLAGKTDIASLEELAELKKEMSSLSKSNESDKTISWNNQNSYAANILREEQARLKKTEGEQPEKTIEGEQIFGEIVGETMETAEAKFDEATEKQARGNEIKVEALKHWEDTRVEGVDFEFSAEIKEKLNPEQLELFEKIEGRIVNTEKPLFKRAIEASALDIMRSVGGAYQKWPLKKKLLVSVGLFAVAFTAGGTVAGAAIGGAMIQRALGGLATFVAAEGALKASAEKKSGGERGVWEARRHTGEALLAGLLVGGGVLGHAIQNVFQEVAPSHEKPGTPTLPREVVDSQIEADNRGLDDLMAAIKSGDAESIRLTEETLGISHEEGLKLIENRAAERLALEEAVGRATAALSENTANNIGETLPPTAEEFEAAIKATETTSPETPALVETQERAPMETTPEQANTPEHTETPARNVSAGEALNYMDTSVHELNTTPIEASQVDPQVAAQMEVYADRTLSEDIDKLFGSKGFLGFGHNNGINSIDWKDQQVGFGNKTVNEIINAHPKAFPEDGVKHFGIEDYTATTKMQGYITNVRRMVGISPNVNENVADFIRRAAIVASKLPSHLGSNKI